MTIHRSSLFALILGMVSGLAVPTSAWSQQSEPPTTTAHTLAPYVPPPLALYRRIPLPGVVGRIDHMGFDTKRNLLLMSALGNNTVEVVDLNAMRIDHTIPGQDRPQGVMYIADSDRILVANEGGKTNIYRADNYALEKTLDVPEGDNVRYDPLAKRAYVASSDGITVIDATTLQLLGTIKLQEEPNSFQLEKNGSRLFANLPRYDSIAVVDRNTLKLIATWKAPPGFHTNFSMQLDEVDHRLFSNFRDPPQVAVFDMNTGKVVAKFGSLLDVDDMFYDPVRKRIYQGGAEGTVGAWQQEDKDHYKLVSEAPSRLGGRTSYMVYTRGVPSTFVVAAPMDASMAAELWCYQLH
jgi:DNA-binding beta-propeller fold protein YncE